MRQASPMVTTTGPKPLSGHGQKSSSFFNRGQTPSKMGSNELSRGHTPFRRYSSRPSSSLQNRTYAYGMNGRNVATPLPKVYSSKSNTGSTLGIPIQRQMTPNRSGYTSSQRISLIPRR